MLKAILAILFLPYKLSFSGGGGGGSTSSTTTQVNYTPEEQADRQKIRTEAERIYGTVPGAPAYPGAGIAGFTQPSINAQNYILGVAGGPLQSMAGDISNATTFGMRDIIYGNDPTLDRAVDATVRPIYQAYTDPGGYFSQLRTDMGQNNTVGGSRDAIAQAVLGGRFAQAAGDAAAKLAAQSRSDTLDTFTRTLAFAPQSMNATMQPGVAMSAVGEQQQAQRQAELDYATQKGYWDLNSPWQQLSNYASFIYGGQTPGTTSTAIGPAARTNPITGALGGAAAGYSLAPMLGATGPIGAGVGALLGLLGGL